MWTDCTCKQVDNIAMQLKLACALERTGDIVVRNIEVEQI